MKNRKSRHNKPVRLSRLTETLLGPALAKRGFTHSRIVTEWPEIAGDAATWSEPANITFPKGKSNDGTLVVNVRSGRGPEMQMLAPRIVERCNAVFGYAAIKRITLTQMAMGPAPAGGGHPPPDQPPEAGDKEAVDLAGIRGASPELRDALGNLGRSVKQRGNRSDA